MCDADHGSGLHKKQKCCGFSYSKLRIFTCKNQILKNSEVVNNTHNNNNQKATAVLFTLHVLLKSISTVIFRCLVTAEIYVIWTFVAHSGNSRTATIH